MFSWLQFADMRLTLGKNSQTTCPSGRQKRDASRRSMDRTSHPLPANQATLEKSSSNSLLFSMDLSTPVGTPTPAAEFWEVTAEVPDVTPALQEIKRLTECRSHFERQVTQAATLIRGACEVAGHVDLERLQQKMQRQHFIVKLLGGQSETRHAVSSACRIRHSYLLCYGKVAGSRGTLPFTSPVPLILDPYFRAQFDIQCPSPAYSTIMEHVPEVYVGSYLRLKQLVRLLCSEMHQAFALARFPLPPWRSIESTLARWEQSAVECCMNDGDDALSSS